MAKNLELLRATRVINNKQNNEVSDQPLPVCPRLIDLYADFLYNGGYKAYQVQTASIEFRKMMYRSFLSTLPAQAWQLTIFDEIQNSEMI